MKYASGLLAVPGGDGDMRSVGGWLSHMVTRAREMFTRRRRHRPVAYGGHKFSTPQLLSEAKLPPDPGLYVIQVGHWWSGLKPIHFGVSPNLHEELIVEGHEGFVQWLTHHGAERGLWISFHADEQTDHGERHREAERIYRHYFPRRVHSFEEHLVTHRFHRSPVHRGHHGHEGRNDSEIR